MHPANCGASIGSGQHLFFKNKIYFARHNHYFCMHVLSMLHVLCVCVGVLHMSSVYNMPQYASQADALVQLLGWQYFVVMKMVKKYKIYT